MPLVLRHRRRAAPALTPLPSSHLLTRGIPLDLKIPPAAHPGGRPIEVLAPNGDRLPFNPGLPVPLGSAVNIVDPLKVHDSTQLHDLAWISPWTPVAVIRSETPGFSALLGAWRADPQLTEIVVLPVESIGAPHQALHAALRVGKAPSAGEVAEWIHRRTDSTPLARAVLAELTQGSTPGRQARHTRFVKSGPLLASGWKNTFRLAQALSYPCHATIDSIAGGVDRDVRTLRTLTQKLLGMTITLARTGFGWRWAVEYILRQHGYLEDADPVSIAVGLPSPRTFEHAWWLRNNGKVLQGEAGRRVGG